MFLKSYCCYPAHVRHSMPPKYKVYFPITCIKVSTLVFNSLFSSSSAAMRCCRGSAGSGALVVKCAGSWAARSIKKLWFNPNERCHRVLHKKLSCFWYLMMLLGLLPIILLSVALRVRCVVKYAFSAIPNGGIGQSCKVYFL